MTKLSSKQLAEMSVEELLNVSIDEIELVQRRIFPAGAYTGLLIAAELPNPSENIEYFNWKFQVTGVIELQDDTKLEEANGLVEAQAVYQERFYTKGGFAVQLMNTRMRDLMAATVGEGTTLGAFFGHVQESDPIPCVFVLRESQTKPNAKKGETYENFTPTAINELGEVMPAE